MELFTQYQCTSLHANYPSVLLTWEKVGGKQPRKQGFAPEARQRLLQAGQGRARSAPRLDEQAGKGVAAVGSWQEYLSSLDLCR